MKSDEINELAAALVKVQSELRGVAKEAENPFFKSKYVTLDGTWDAVRPHLADNGLAVVQTTEVVGQGAVLVTMLVHTSGQWIRGDYPLNPVKTDPQGLGSAVTYARRYALQAILGVTAGDDDDGNAGSHASQPATKSAGKTPKAAPVKGKETQHDLDPTEYGQMRTMYALLTGDQYDVEHDMMVQKCLPEGYTAFSDVDKKAFNHVMTQMALMKRTMDDAFKAAK